MLALQRRLSTPFLVLLTLPATAMGFALSVQISALSWILSTQYHLELHEIGLVWAAGPLAGIVGQLLIGVISDKLGLVGILGVAIAVALSLDLSINVSFNPTRSLITDVTPEGAPRVSGYTWMQTVSGTFGVLAYAIGAFFDNYVLSYVGAVLVLAFSVIPALLIEEPRVLPGADAALRGHPTAGTGPGALLLMMLQPL